VLVEQWKTVGSKLPEDWTSAELTLALRDRAGADAAALLLGPAQPYRVEPTALTLYVARDGSATSPAGIQRLLHLIDRQRITGTLSIVSTAVAPEAQRREAPSLVASWEAELARLPADWTDLLAELELDSTDYVERASLLCVPMNLRRDGARAALCFRVASRFGYGASTTMVRRCLERCDADGITGKVTVLRVFSDTRPVATQGPVWLVAGKTT
jgi:hypothetical protein